jgi:hypothetical protein
VDGGVVPFGERGHVAVVTRYDLDPSVRYKLGVGNCTSAQKRETHETNRTF